MRRFLFFCIFFGFWQSGCIFIGFPAFLGTVYVNPYLTHSAISFLRLSIFQIAFWKIDKGRSEDCFFDFFDTSPGHDGAGINSMTFL